MTTLTRHQLAPLKNWVRQSAIYQTGLTYAMTESAIKHAIDLPSLRAPNNMKVHWGDHKRSLYEWIAVQQFGTGLHGMIYNDYDDDNDEDDDDDETIMKYTEILDVQCTNKYYYQTSDIVHFTRLFHLRKLNISCCGSYATLRYLPNSIGKLINLRELDVSRHDICELPPSFAALIHLRVLCIERGNLSIFPTVLANCTKLRSLSLSGHQIQNLPPWVPDTLTQLRQLYLSGNPLYSLPDNFGNLIELGDLSLSDCHLSRLPDSFRNLTQLYELHIGYNQLNGLPDYFRHFTQLQHLSLRDFIHDELTEPIIPEWIGELTHLWWLDVSINNLTTLPPHIAHLPSNAHVEADCNNISRLERQRIRDMAPHVGFCFSNTTDPDDY